MINNKKKSRKREVAAAKDIEGRAHIASGALWFRKADLSNEKLLVEDKFTNANKYTLSYANLQKLEKQALKIRKTPVFRFGFDKHKTNFVLVRSTDYNNYLPGVYKEIIVDKKSLSLSITGMVYFLSALKAKEIILAEIHFTQIDKKYLLVEWTDFVNNQPQFVA